jgi:hypothetical protein
MLRIISEEEMEKRTAALTKAVPERKREVVAQEIRPYAEEMDRRYCQLADCLEKHVGKGAEVVLKEMNKPKFEWDRSVAARIERKTRE